MEAPVEDKMKMMMILRKDLGMRKGKMVAQGGHGVVHLMLGDLLWEAHLYGTPDKDYTTSITIPKELVQWVLQGQRKICVGAKDEDHIYQLHQQALVAGIKSVIITDSGLTEFAGKPTVTCCIMGPAPESVFASITEGLPLL